MDREFLEILLSTINEMTLKVLSEILEKSNSFEEFKSGVLATLQNLEMADSKENNNDK